MAGVELFRSVLIANRGEIAVRVARTCRALGIRTIAVFSDADAGALHTRVCDEAIGIGGVAPRDSYLRGDLIIAAARRAEAQSIHPGYGFLSENAEFAQACADAGIVFIGPSPAAMRAVGDKITAKKTATSVGVPVLAGYDDRDQSSAVLEAQARRIGVPLLIKAAAGGGGRGMRLVSELSEFAAALDGAQREAKAAFGDATVFLERYVENPRHIEVQVLADCHGNFLALGERECSIQRRYQKIVEESPSPAVDQTLRSTFEQAALTIARAVNYLNAGTVEFMLDETGRHYFLEMNARLQVEHPVTECVTNTDLVRQQLIIAAGGAIDLNGTVTRGHAIEARIYAEDALHDFLPSIGRLTVFEAPQGDGIRNDVAVEARSVVSGAYDPMLAKLIVYGSDRQEAVARMRHALEEYIVGGVATNLGFLQWLVEQAAFVEGQTTTNFLPQYFRPSELEDRSKRWNPDLAAAAVLVAGSWRHSALPRKVDVGGTEIDATWSYQHGAWLCKSGERDARINGLSDATFEIQTNNQKTQFAAWFEGGAVVVNPGGLTKRFSLREALTDAPPDTHYHGETAVKGSIVAPMTGTIVKVNTKVGDTVKAFSVLMVMEAMKMEHSIVAPYSGKVTGLHVAAGAAVAAGEVLAELTED